MSNGFVSAGKWASLLKEMAKLGIAEEDIEEQFILSSGAGGQKVNKTCSCVRLRHVPSGTQIKCGESRYREVNRYLARKRLCLVIEERHIGEASRVRQEREKIRRRKRRRTRRQNERRLAEKHRTSEIKQLRSTCFPPD